jgi:uncharacterized protein YktA (UPF0223 family)
MSDPCLFGWAASEVVRVIKLCDEFIKAYSNGPSGASNDFKQLYEHVERFKNILKKLKDELDKQDTKGYIDWDAIYETFEQCRALSKGYSVYSRPRDQRGTAERLVATSKYMWSGKDAVKELCSRLEWHIKYVTMYLQLVCM